MPNIAKRRKGDIKNSLADISKAKDCSIMPPNFNSVKALL